MRTFLLIIPLLCLTVSSAAQIREDLFEVSVIHLNDFHARFEETSTSSTRCTDKANCIGGFSRIYTAVNRLMKERPNAIFLNAGDNYQGTLWFNVHRWNVTQYFLNKLPTDAYADNSSATHSSLLHEIQHCQTRSSVSSTRNCMISQVDAVVNNTLGNHEFDDKIEGVVPFIQALNAPVVVANIDDREEPEMQGIYNKSTIIYREGRKIGIIGVILSTTNEISSTENLRFTDEIEAVNREAQRLSKEENCTIIIVLSHCGIDVDKKIAKYAGPHVNLIVGGHTHTFLYSGRTPPGPDKPTGPYPVIVRQDNGRNVLVVQASLNAKYLGNLSVWYNENGDLVKWSGNPIYLDNKIPQDTKINEEIDVWKYSVDAYGAGILGSSKVLLDQSSRRTGESNLGSFLADAMVDHYVQYAEKGSWTYSSIAIINSGCIRTSILPGNITLNDLVTAQPFENTIDVGELSGQNIKDILEYSVTPSVIRRYQFHEFLQVSGIRVVFDTSKPIGSRVKKVQVLCNHCLVPTYSDLDITETYQVIVPSFLAVGGDGYSLISDNLKNRKVGEQDLDVYSKYIKKMSPITQAHDERIILEDSEEIQDALEFNSSTTVESSAFSFMCCTFSLMFCYKLNIFYKF